MFQKKTFILTALLLGLFIQSVSLTWGQSLASTPPVGFEVVASNLNNPRGMAFGADGGLYIAEAGEGAEGGGCITTPEGEVCYGASGAITRVLDGNQEQVVTGLPSLAGADGSNATGPHDIAFDSDGTLHVVIGLGANPAAREELGEEGANFGQLAAISASGEITYLADLAGYEGSQNPDGSLVDSNPFSLLATENGFVASDAGGNSVLEITPTSTRDNAGATIELLTVIPTRTVEFPPGTPRSMEAVPTGMAQGPDGAIYVAELTGFPFPVGGARVYRVVPDEEPELYADGFTNILDIAFDSDGNLYVLEMATNGLLSGDQTGALIRVAPDGSHQTIASKGLTSPTGIGIGADNAIYISNMGPAAGTAQVIRLNPTDVTAVSMANLNVSAPQLLPVGTLALLALIATGVLFAWRRE